MLGYDGEFWSHHPELAGGYGIAYGHRLSNEEVSSGKIVISGIEYTFFPTSNITDEVATTILEEDVKRAEDKVRRMWTGIDEKYIKILIILEFGTKGSVTPNTWPKLKAAIEVKDDTKVSEEVLTSYKSPTGRVFLNNRAVAISEAFNLRGNDA